MGFISWIILGLIAGVLAKILMPGNDAGGFVMTIILGIAGAFFGGWLGSFFGVGSTGSLSFDSVATATAGAFILLFINKKIR